MSITAERPRIIPHVITTDFCPHCAGIGVVEATDIFCGAGGSSLGLEFVCCQYCGRSLIKVTQCINHWDLAVEAHNANFQDADHDVHGVEEIPASRFRRTPILWASPECVNHTSCKGKRDDSPEAMRSRATFKDIVRFTEHHHYDAIIVENVIEARAWCEHEKCACGADFDAWFSAIIELGYEGKIVYFNSQFALPTPQSRDRMYVVFWRKGLARPELDFGPVSWCSHCQTIVNGVQTFKKASRGSLREKIFEWGRYGANYVYRCPNEGCGNPVAPAVMGAKTIIDRSLPIEQIKDKKPTHCNKCGKRHPVACNTRRRIKVGWENMHKRVPMAVQVGGNLYERDGYARVWSLDRPLKTITTTRELALVAPAGSQEAKAREAGEPMHSITCTERLAMVTADRDGNIARSVDEPTNSLTTQSQLGFVTRVGGQSENHNGRSLDEPMNTILTNDRQIGLVLPNMNNATGASENEPTGTVTTGTGGNQMLVQVNRGSKGKDDAGHRTQSLDLPHPTVAGHGEMGIVEFHGENGSVRQDALPIHTVLAGGTHHGMLVYNGSPGHVRHDDEPTGVVTSRDHHSLLVPYYQTGVARSAAEPLGAITTHDREAFVVTDADIDECYLRMLQWQELLRAQQMHMRPDGSAYELTARRRNKHGKMIELSNELRTKMIGNAVSAPVATMLGHAVVGILR